MTRTMRDISVLVACAAALAGCSAGGSDPGSSADPPAVAPSSSSSVSTSASPGEPPQPGETAKATPGSEPASPGEPSAPATSEAPDAVGSDGPVEVPPPEPSESGLPGLSPAPKPAKSLISRPLPARATAQGALVRGYPAAVLPAAPDSTIESSSLSPEDRRLQVALNARTSRGAGALLLFYRQKLASLGFTEEQVTAVGGSRAAGFRRGQNSVTVTVKRAGDVSSYTLFSTLYAG